MLFFQKITVFDHEYYEIFRLVVLTVRDDSLKMTPIKSFSQRDGHATTEMRLFEPNEVPAPMGEKSSS